MKQAADGSPQPVDNRPGAAAEPGLTIATERPMFASMEASSIPEWRRLYEEAFSTYGVSALWSYRPLPAPRPGHALAISRALRANGDLRARDLAERLAQATRAAE